MTIYPSKIKALLCSTALSVCAVAVAMPAAANPENGQIVGGSATISQDDNKLNIIQHTDRAVIDWRTFNIDAGEHTQFYQPNSNSIAVNRIRDNNPSQIHGKLEANGNIVLINPNGVLFGSGAAVDVNGMLATTADIDTNAFMNGSNRFDKPGNPNAIIRNDGRITAKEAGLVGLVGPKVINNGVINAKLGRAELASGDTVTVDFRGNGLTEIAVSDKVKEQLVAHNGHIRADGGTIAVTAAAGKDIVNSLIDIKGEMKALAISNKNGKIQIFGAGSNAVAGNVAADKAKKTGNSQIVISGKLDVSGKETNQKGGEISVAGDHIHVKNGAVINASGDAGGGQIRIGGDYQGKGALAAAKKVIVESGSRIDNNAITNGDGGRTILWSDDVMAFEGKIEGRGGSHGGNGGFAEVSGHQLLHYNGLTDLTAAKGETGTLLLDPTDITISNAPQSNINFSNPTYSGTGATSNLNITTLQNQLALSNVTVTTSSAHAGNGDITVVDPITWASTRILTLTADRDVIVNNTITSSGSTSSLVLNAGRDITLNANVTNSGTSGNMTAIAGRHLTINSGIIVSAGNTGATNLRAANGVTTNVGLLTNNGILQLGSGALTLISGIDGSGQGRDLTLNNSNFVYKNGTVGTTSITGFRDMNVLTDLNGSGNMTIIANRHLTIGSGAILSSGVGSNTMNLKAAGGSNTDLGILSMNGILRLGTGSFTLSSGVDSAGNSVDLILNNSNLQYNNARTGSTTISGFRDINILGDLYSNNNVSIIADRHLTIGSGANVGSGTGHTLTLRAAGGTIGNLGILTLNGNLQVGSNSVTLLSGVDAMGLRPDLTLTNANLSYRNSTMGAFNVTGFRDVNVLTDLNSTGALSIIADRHLTIGSGVTVTVGNTSATNLSAANGLTGNLGVLTMNGTLRAGSAGLTLISGVAESGEGSDLTLSNSNFSFYNGSGSTTSIRGFRDINVLTDLNLSAHNLSITAKRHLTIGNGVTLSSGPGQNMTLRAANGDVNGIGLLTLNGTLVVGTGLFTLTSGVDSLGQGADLTLNNSNLQYSNLRAGSITISGFRDINILGNFYSNQLMDVTANRHLTIGSGANVASGRNSNQGMVLKAAGGVTTNLGILTMNGNLVVGYNTVTLLSGVDAMGERPDLTLTNTNFSYSNSAIGALTLTGFRDINVQRDLIITNLGMVLRAWRHLTIDSGVTLRAAASGMSLQAANGDVNGLGLLTMNGNLVLGTATLTMVSGLDSAGQGADLSFNNTNLTYSNGINTGAFSISGFRDIQINRDLATTASVNITAQRHLTVNNGVHITPGNASTISLRAANGITTNTGLLRMNGILNTGSGSLTLVSGLNSASDYADLTLTNSNLVYQNLAPSVVTIQGFRDIMLNMGLTTQNDLTVNAGRDVVIGSNGMLTSENGNMALAATRNFINQRGSDALNTPHGRWLVYSSNPGQNVRNGLMPGEAAIYGATFTSHDPLSISGGNRFLFSDAAGNAPVLVVHADNKTKTYGMVNGTLTYTITGFVDQDNAANALNGTVGLSTAVNHATGVGSYDIVADASGLSSLLGYQITNANGSYQINRANLVVQANNAIKLYGTNLVFNGNEFMTSGLINGDQVHAAQLTSAGAGTTAAGANYPIMISNATGIGLNNYNVTYVQGGLTVINNNSGLIGLPGSNQTGILPSTVDYTSQNAALMAMNRMEMPISDKSNSSPNLADINISKLQQPDRVAVMNNSVVLDKALVLELNAQLVRNAIDEVQR